MCRNKINIHILCFAFTVPGRFFRIRGLRGLHGADRDSGQEAGPHYGGGIELGHRSEAGRLLPGGPLQPGQHLSAWQPVSVRLGRGPVRLSGPQL